MADAADAMSPAGIEVEVVHCKSRSVVDSVRLRLPLGASVDDAVRAAGVLQRHPELDAVAQRLGIWGRLVPETQILCDGDRVEIYRPLLVEPKEARRLRQRSQSLKRSLKGS
ncbi:MAG: RnfH family protein [Ideonella sp.]